MKKIISILLCAVLLICAIPAAAFAGQQTPSLKFNSDGSFKILVFADCQDDMFPRKAMLAEMEKALDELKPDLVVYTGDNQQGLATAFMVKGALKAIIEPVTDRGIPFAFTFGNHDAEIVDRETQLKIYQSFEGCLTYDAAPEIEGCGTCNIPVYASDGSGKAKFNLWMIDSNMYDDENGGYDYVHQDQLDWCAAKSNELAAANGGEKVPSIVFQHIPVQEIYELLKPGDTERFGYNVSMELNEQLATGHIGEWPCPPNYNSGQFAAMKSQGDVLAIVTGHDHINSFEGSYMGIDFLQTAGIGFQTYGDKIRGCRLITLNESNPWQYETTTYDYAHFFGTDDYAEYFYLYYGTELPRIFPFLNGFLDKRMQSDKAPETLAMIKSIFNFFDSLKELFD